MQTLLHILKQAGGWTPSLYLKIEHQPYMALVIEATDESGPTGLPCISVAHYGKQNGDLMRDPEMWFEVHEKTLDPFYYRNDYLGIEQWSRSIERGLLYHHITLHHQHRQFAKHWDENLRTQGFLEALERQLTHRA
jgi:hypothetical protein